MLFNTITNINNSFKVWSVLIMNSGMLSYWMSNSGNLVRGSHACTHSCMYVGTQNKNRLYESAPL